MKKQKEIYEAFEGNTWFRRNKVSHHLCEKEWKDDDIFNFMKSIDFIPKKVLELGTSNGKRLYLLNEFYKCEGFGIDPSVDAIEDGKKRFPEISLRTGTADNIPFDDHAFDTIIVSFFLLMCDRDDLFKIAMEIDRCLQNGGMLIIRDFYPLSPYKNHYGHLEGLYSYKMDYSHMFTWNPAYTEMDKRLSSHSSLDFKEVPDERVVISALYKNENHAYPDNPYISTKES